MEIFDLVALSIIAISIALSLLRGLASEVMSLAAWFIAFFVAKSSTATFAKMVPISISVFERARVAIAFVVVFALVWVLTVLVRMALSKLINASGLGGLNRLLGAFFGGLRGVALVTAITLVCGMTSLPQRPSWQKAYLTAPFEKIVEKTSFLLPKAIAGHVHYPDKLGILEKSP